MKVGNKTPACYSTITPWLII